MSNFVWIKFEKQWLDSNSNKPRLDSDLALATRSRVGPRRKQKEKRAVDYPPVNE